MSQLEKPSGSRVATGRNFTDPTDEDWAGWVERLLNGEEPSEAARAVGQTCTQFRRHDRQAHHDALELSREIRGGADREYVRDRLRANVERSMRAVPVFDHDGEPTGEYTYEGQVANRALELLGKQAGLFNDAHVEVEHTGGVEVTVEHDYDRILDKLAGVGLLVRRGEAAAVDASAIEVLPARAD